MTHTTYVIYIGCICNIQMCAMKQKQASSPVKKRRRVVEEEEIDGVFISDRPRKRAKVNYAE